MTPIRDLPPLASEFAKWFCGRDGGNTEVYLHAFTVYAQCVEGLSCNDKFVPRADDIGREELWIKCCELEIN